jgi:hypothetical protein
MKKSDFKEIEIIPDDKIKSKNQLQIKLPIFSIDTSKHLKKPNLLKN